MTMKRLPPDDPLEWLHRSHSNLAQARVQDPEIYLEDLCFNAQQAVEKALKGLLLRRRVRFPYTHNLEELLGLLETESIALPHELQQVVRLSEYAVEGRYPGGTEPLTQEEYRGLLTLAERVVAWVESRLESEP